MSHHSEECPLSPEDEAVFKEAWANVPNHPSAVFGKLHQVLSEEAKALNLGATGEYPRGKLASHDKGGIKMSLGTYKNTVLINFGTPVSAVGFSKLEAYELAHAIMSNADRL